MVVKRQRLGQCFLIDQQALRRIEFILQDEVSRDVPILEIGAGGGALTEILLRLTSSKVMAVELDRRWVNFLKQRFSSDSKFVLIEGDFRKVSLPDFSHSGFYLISNIPYYLTGEVLEFAYLRADLISAYLMLQRDLVRKILAPPGSSKYSAFSVVVQVFFEVKERVVLSPKSFSPPPKVWSSFVSFWPREELRGVHPETRQNFASLVRKAFSHRRKMLKRNLDDKILKSVPREWWEKRPQEISPWEWWNWFRDTTEGRSG